MRLPALVLLAAAIPSASHAQAADTGSVPRELAQALLVGHGQGSSRPAIVVGRAPRTIPPGLVPAGARVLGGLERTRPARGAFAAPQTVALAMPQPPGEADAALRAHLLAAGFRGRERAGGGFTPALSDSPAILCRDGTYLTLSFAPRDGGGSLVVMAIGAAPPDAGPCAPVAGRRPAHGDARGIFRRADMLPPLVPPPAARQVGGGSSMGAGIDDFTVETRLDAAMRAADILAHYVAQLRAAGWTVGAPLAGDGLATVAIAAPPRAGEPAWSGAFTVTSLPGTTLHDVAIRLLTPGDRQAARAPSPPGPR